MSLGYAGLMGFGGYTAAILSRDFGMNMWMAMPFSVLVAALCAGLFGLPSLRISGHHFAITTYVMCELLRIALINGGKFTGAATGLDLPPMGMLFGVKLDKLANAYELVAAFMFLSMLAAYCVANSRYGRTLRSIRENEQLARVDRRQRQPAQSRRLHAERLVRGRRGRPAGVQFPAYLAGSLWRRDQSLFRADGDARRTADNLWPAGGGHYRDFSAGGHADRSGRFAHRLWARAHRGGDVAAGRGDRRSRTRLSVGGAQPYTARQPIRVQPTPARPGPEERPTVATLEIRALRKTFGGVVALAGVDLTVRSEEILGVIGPNGSGKTTLFNTVCGVYRPSAGPSTGTAPTSPASPLTRSDAWASHAPFSRRCRFPRLRCARTFRSPSSTDRGAQTALDRDGRRRRSCFSSSASRRSPTRSPTVMPFGNLRRLGVAVALGGRPSQLLLDEPAAGLNEGESVQLIHLLRRAHELGVGHLHHRPSCGPDG